ncbi:uncharacterized protein LOC143051249 [Mytilus galloprovincialis]|uniref:uncharacterized protein LOC143051249 n=1 Tax=Mytilus galloprovincialis TaxID=29158 RepID=UPI003F7B77D8
MGPSTQTTISTPPTTQASTTPTKAQLTTSQAPLYSISATHQAVTSSSSTTSQQPSSSRHQTTKLTTRTHNAHIVIFTRPAKQNHTKIVMNVSSTTSSPIFLQKWHTIRR